MQPAKFTRENKANKVTLWNCFVQGGTFSAIPAVQARAQIGEHAPKYLLSKDYLRQFPAKNVDMYQLTPEGIAWLTKGTLRYLELHPEAEALVISPHPRGAKPTASGTKRIIRRRP